MQAAEAGGAQQQGSGGGAYRGFDEPAPQGVPAGWLRSGPGPPILILLLILILILILILKTRLDFLDARSAYTPDAPLQFRLPAPLSQVHCHF